MLSLSELLYSQKIPHASMSFLRNIHHRPAVKTPMTHHWQFPYGFSVRILPIGHLEMDILKVEHPFQHTHICDNNNLLKYLWMQVNNLTPLDYFENFQKHGKLLGIWLQEGFWLLKSAVCRERLLTWIHRFFSSQRLRTFY